MTTENKPLSTPSTEVQRLAREAIWVQGITQTMLRGINTAEILPVQQEIVTRLTRTLFELAEKGFTKEAWENVISVASLGAQVASDISVAVQFAPQVPVEAPADTKTTSKPRKRRTKNDTSSKSS